MLWNHLTHLPKRIPYPRADSGVEFRPDDSAGLGHKMKLHFHLAIALYMACSGLLLAQGNQSVNDQKPPTAKPDKEGQNEPIDILSDTGGVDVHPYLGRALPLLRTSWYAFVPESAATKPAKVTIRFSISKDGHIHDVHFAEKSGDSDLDKAAYLGITAADPLPSLPSDFACEYLRLQIRFYYNLAVPPAEAPTSSVIPCVTSRISFVQPVVITVSPVNAEVITGATQQFTATVTGEPGTEVKWTVSGSGCSAAVCGTVSPQGLYAAPTSIPRPPKVIVTATLANDPTTDIAKATVTVVQPPKTR